MYGSEQTNITDLDPCILESLSEIKSNPIRRRLTKELSDLQKMTNNNFLYVQSVEINQKGIPVVTIVDYSTENLNVYEFTTISYPFSVPKIKVNSSDYSEFLRIRTLTFQHLLKKIKGIGCFCCNSYLCSDRWTPALRFIHIIEEIRMFRKYKREIINKLYADKIKDKYLIADIDLDSWLF